MNRASGSTFPVREKQSSGFLLQFFNCGRFRRSISNEPVSVTVLLTNWNKNFLTSCHNESSELGFDVLYRSFFSSLLTDL